MKYLRIDHKTVIEIPADVPDNVAREHYLKNRGLNNPNTKKSLVINWSEFIRKLFWSGRKSKLCGNSHVPVASDHCWYRIAWIWDPCKRIAVFCPLLNTCNEILTVFRLRKLQEEFLSRYFIRYIGPFFNPGIVIYLNEFFDPGWFYGFFFLHKLRFMRQFNFTSDYRIVLQYDQK